MAIARVRRAMFARHAHPLSSVVTSVVAVVALVAARQHRAGPAAVAVAAQMALTLAYWRQMVRYLDDHR